MSDLSGAVKELIDNALDTVKHRQVVIHHVQMVIRRLLDPEALPMAVEASNAAARSVLAFICISLKFVPGVFRPIGLKNNTPRHRPCKPFRPALP